MTARWIDDTEAAAWIALDPDQPAMRLASMVPRTFPRFARVFHPLYLRGHGRLLRWAEVAAINDRHMHPRARLSDVLVREDDEITNWSDLLSGQMSVGVLPVQEFGELWRALRPHTSSSRLILGFWEGFNVERSSGPRPKVEVGHAGNRYVLAELPIDDISDSHQLNPGFSPNLVWPEDRSWFWHTGVDETSTYVGGTTDAIKAVLSSSALEAAPLEIDAVL